MEIENGYYIGIDIGSTASKTIVLDEKTVVDAFTLPTGWNGRETAQGIYETLLKLLNLFQENSLRNIIYYIYSYFF